MDMHGHRRGITPGSSSEAQIPARPRSGRKARLSAIRDLTPKDRPNQAAGVPLYEQIKRQISEMILLGAWPPGFVLPNESALASTLGVAVGTLRRALAELTAEGLLVRRRKTGTAVTGRAPHHSLRMCFQYFRLHGPGDSLVRSRAIVCAHKVRAASREEARTLQIPDGAQVHDFERVRRVDGVPVMRDRTVISSALVPDLTESADIPELFYGYLLEHHGIRISALREKISADLANRDDRRWLEQRGQFAVLVIEELAFDQTGSPVLIANRRAITRGFKYINEVS
jgi:GntR family transcriptional regulator